MLNTIQWHEVTPFSKWCAVFVFIVVVPVLCFYIGVQYGEVRAMLEKPGAIPAPFVSHHQNPQGDAEQVFTDTGEIDNPAPEDTLPDTTPTTPPHTVALTINEPSGPVAVGDAMTFGDTLITINRVVEDSRCPANAMCVRAGEVILELGVTSGGNVSKVLLSTSGAPEMMNSIDPTQYDRTRRAYKLGDSYLSIASVSPEKGKTGEYSFTFLVSK